MNGTSARTGRILRSSVTAALTALPVAAGAQDATPVEAVRIDPDPIVVQMGDTLVVQGTPVDSAGRLVADVIWGATDATVFELEAVAVTDSSQLFHLWGSEVGQGVMGIFVAELTENGPQWRQLGDVPVEVIDYPVARVELDALAVRPYAGTTLTPTARVLNSAGDAHATARAAWTTSDSTVARATEDGAVHLLRPGPVRLVVSADTVHVTVELDVLPNPVASVSLREPPGGIRTGDAVPLDAVALSGKGEPVDSVALSYRVERDGGADGATTYSDGVFVAAAPGTYRVEASAGDAVGSVELEVFPREVDQSISYVAHVPTPRATDLWVFEGLDGRDYAYIGTLSAATMYAIDVTDPTRPVVTDSVKADGRRVNDVKINEDRTLAIITSESAPNRRNGITLLDISTPAHPRIVTHYTENLTGGVHNVWFVGDLVYAVNDGTLDVHIIDISDPASPSEVGRWGLERRGRYLHDVSVVDGLAYLSYWNDGVVILDVGAGLEGGTAVEPQLVSSFKYRYEINGEPFGNTHHAIRYGDYLFLGDEIFGCPGCQGPRGYVHVVDVSDIRHPREVAYYRLPEAGSHNLWVEDDRLYVAYYQGGVRVVDVSGELRGDLLAQGREIASFFTDPGTLDPGTGGAGALDPGTADPGAGAASAEGSPPPPVGSASELGPALQPPGPGSSAAGGPLAWGPQPYKGHLFVSDMNSGLWIVRLDPRVVLP